MSSRTIVPRPAAAMAPCLGLLLALPAAVQAQQQGVVTGRVTDAGTGQPIVAVQIQVIGTNLGAQTNTEGQFTIRSVPAGAQTVRAIRVGYAEQKLAVTVSAGQTATLNVQMRTVAASLTPVVTTATGEQRRVEVGNAIAQVNAQEIVATRAVGNVTDVLAARAPGVQVLQGTQTGAGTRVRIRGTSSLSLTNNPIYVIDGVRMESSTGSLSGGIGVGGTTPSRVGDLNPEEIQSIEVVRGPSAATLYGTDAANGVIVITTKRGQAGRPQWSYYGEQTAITDRNPYPSAYRAWRTGTTAATTSTAANSVQCFLTQVASNACKQDSVSSYNLFKDAESTPYGVGYRQQHGLQLSGGSETARYFVAGEYENEDGATKVPEFEQRYLASRGLSLRPEMRDPNALLKKTARANLNLSLPRNFDLAASTSYIQSDLRLPTSDDSGVSGIGANVYGGPGFKYNLSPTGDTLYGWRQFTPRDIYQQVTNQSIQRALGSLNANWRPSSWLAFRGNFGLDYTNRTDTQLCRFANCPDVGTDRQGFKRDYRTNFFTYTLDVGATGSRNLTETIQSKTTVGTQFIRSVFDRNGAEGIALPPGAVQVTAGATKLADEAQDESRTLGAYIEESLAFSDRFFLTGAVRSDRNSAFGANFKTVFYPKLSASWVVSQEPWMPKWGWMDQLRLRSAYGASGVQPGTTDAAPYYSTALARTESGDQAGVVFTTLGNRGLKPERSTELEFGVDGTFFGGRITTELTRYDKSSRDALVSRTLPPSLGTGATTRFENLGQVTNKGWEALVTVQPVQKRLFAWDVTVNGSTNTNKLVSLGGVPTIVSSSSIRQVEGYPLNGYWSPRITSYADRNGNGIIEASEITVSSTPEFFGYSAPRHELVLTNGFETLNKKVRLTAMIDYKGGHYGYNNTERIRCSNRLNCRGLLDPSASLWEQARSVALREDPSRTISGFFEKADYIRFRELSLTYTPSRETVQRLVKGRSLSATLAARNLGILWTKYTGVDPEAFFGATGNAPSEFQAAAPPTWFSFRLNLGF